MCVVVMHRKLTKYWREPTRKISHFWLWATPSGEPPACFGSAGDTVQMVTGMDINDGHGMALQSNYSHGFAAASQGVGRTCQDHSQCLHHECCRQLWPPIVSLWRGGLPLLSVPNSLSPNPELKIALNQGSTLRMGYLNRGDFSGETCHMPDN